CLFHRRFVRLDVCPTRSSRRHRSVPLLIANDFFVEQIARAFFIRVGLCQIGLVFGQRSLGLCQRGFKRAWVDLKKQIAFFDQAPFLVRSEERRVGKGWIS